MEALERFLEALTKDSGENCLSRIFEVEDNLEDQSHVGGRNMGIRTYCCTLDA